MRGFPALKSQTCGARRSNKVGDEAHGHITLADLAGLILRNCRKWHILITLRLLPRRMCRTCIFGSSNGLLA